MLAAIQSSEEGSVEAETSDGSASMSSMEQEVMTEKSTEVAPGSTCDATEEDLLGHSESDGNKEEVHSDCFNTTMVPITFLMMTKISGRIYQPGLESVIKPLLQRMWLSRRRMLLPRMGNLKRMYLR